MFSPVVRWMMGLATLLFGAYRIYLGDITGWVYFIPSVILIFGYWRQGSVWLAFRAIGRGELDLAEDYLKKTPQTSLLSATNRAYQAWVEGAIALGRQEVNKAEERFKMSLGGALRSDNDKAVVHCILAEIAHTRGDSKASVQHLASARVLDKTGRQKAVIDRISHLNKSGGDALSPDAFDDLFKDHPDQA